MNENNYNNYYENNTEDVDDSTKTDVTINPDYYIHIALKKAQFVLTNPDIKTGLTQFWVIVEHIESICKASGILIEDEYKTAIEDEYKNIKETDENKRQVKIALKKIELLMKAIFSKKIKKDPLIFRKKDLYSE